MRIDLDQETAADGGADGELAGRCLRALAEPVRWRIAQLLAREQLCVCHLTEELGISQSLASHHLRVLRDAGLVAGERHRYWTYYRLRSAPLAAAAGALGALAGAAAVPPGDQPRRPCC